MNLNDEFNKRVVLAEKVLKDYMPKEAGYQKDIMSAMNYSVSAGGKRLRPLILMSSYMMYKPEGEVYKPFMAALEMIHNYSLVHDDLPCMDNDRLRRGKDTTWVKYGECMAVLTGDGLLNYAFETALKAFDMCSDIAEYKNCANAMKILANKAGIYGMIGGQVVDTAAEQSCSLIDEDELLFIHENKTGALLEAAFMCGAVLAGAVEDEVKKLSKVALNVGLAFQIQDDILDIEGDEKVLGKPVGSDEENQKQTYVRIHGMEKSKKDVISLIDEAVEILNSLNRDTEFLEYVIKSLIGRKA